VGVESADIATLAAMAATVASIACTWPQLVRIRRTSDIAGVSITAALLTVSSELGWTAYLAGEGLWSAVPEGVLNIAANALLAIAVVRAGGSARAAAGAAATWLAVLVASRTLVGPTALAALLGIAYAVQLTPAVVTAWRTWSPSGISVPTWTLRLTEALLWGVYGHIRGDTPLVLFGVLGTLESCAVLLRKYLTRHRPSTVEIPAPAFVSHPLDNAMVG
jgi:uncharacterized protein with PQ loop repeat